jgi:hypothetical protein
MRRLRPEAVFPHIGLRQVYARERPASVKELPGAAGRDAVESGLGN